MNTKKLLTLLTIGFIITCHAQAQGLQFCLQSKKGNKFLKSVKTSRVEREGERSRSVTKKEMALYPKSSNLSSMTKFRLKPVRGERGYYYIQTIENYQGRARSTYLSVPQNGNQKSKPGMNLFRNTDQYKWKFEPTGNGEYNIKNRLGRYLDVQWGKSETGTPIWMWPKNGDPAQVFRIIPIRNGELSTRRAPLQSVIPSNTNNTENGRTPNRNTTNRVISNPKVKVTVLNIKATHGDDGGSDRTFEFYTKIRVAKGHEWNARNVAAYHYPKWSSSFFKSEPYGYGF
jgi:hypothetical protein